MCIRVLGGSKKRYAKVGDIIKVTVKEAIKDVTNASSDLINEKINTPIYSGIDLLIILFTKTTSTFIR